MANNYSQCTPYTSLKCTKEQAHKLIDLLEIEVDEDDECLDHGFNGEYYEKNSEFYMYANESFDTECIPNGFTMELGKVIKKNKLPYLEFGYAFTCDKMRPGEFGGGTFRIYPDSNILYPTITWEK